MIANSDRSRYVVLPGDACNFTNITVALASPTATAYLDASERADLRANLRGAYVYLDAVSGAGALTVLVALPVEAEDAAVPGTVQAPDPKPHTAIVGQRFDTRLLCLALDALHPGPLAVVWRRHLDPLTLHALEAPAGHRDAMVMPVRCCAASPYSPAWRPDCPCRDCAAGRRWGW